MESEKELSEWKKSFEEKTVGEGNPLGGFICNSPEVMADLIAARPKHPLWKPPTYSELAAENERLRKYQRNARKSMRSLQQAYNNLNFSYQMSTLRSEANRKYSHAAEEIWRDMYYKELKKASKKELVQIVMLLLAIIVYILVTTWPN